MPLMFSRAARNFIRNGYFPTDEQTLVRVLGLIEPVSSGLLRILDPCAGEGAALAELKHALGAAHIESHAVEFDAERAQHAATITDVCLHADLHDCLLSERSFSLLWLNPPYGHRVADRVSASDPSETRLEKTFYRRTIGSLQWGGLLVLIIPHTSLDAEFCTRLARGLEQISIHRAATDQFRQVVILGYRRRPATSGWQSERDRLLAIGQGDVVAPILPEAWDGPMYRLVAGAPLRTPPIQVTRYTPEQLAQAVATMPVLWNVFSNTFQRQQLKPRQPLREPSDWHLALMLSAGQLDGVIRAKDGQQYAIRGHTSKVCQSQTDVEHDDESGKTTEVRVVTERFLPVIRLLQITPGSSDRGQLLTVA